MCLLAIAWKAHPRFRLVIAANRDEFHVRAASPAGIWTGEQQILAGRDLQAGGTWLGINRVRQLGVVTNYRELTRPRRGAPSRGGLIPSYLGSGRSAASWLGAFDADSLGYAGFSLLLADRDELWYASNRTERFARLLQPGVYGLSNHVLDTPWPKLEFLKSGLEDWCARPDLALEQLFELLADRVRRHSMPGAELGPTHEWSEVLSSAFVSHAQYGTRCSTVASIDCDGAVHFIERSFAADGRMTGESEFQLNGADWPAAQRSAEPA
jgi:uncharacterized protein with NRDE domain